MRRPRPIARRAWGGYGETLQSTHGNVPPHLQTEMPDWDNPLAKAMMSRDPIETGLLIAGASSGSATTTSSRPDADWRTTSS